MVLSGRHMKWCRPGIIDVCNGVDVESLRCALELTRCNGVDVV